MHGVDKAKAFLHTASFDQIVDGIGDIDEPAPGGDFEPEVFRQRFHPADLAVKGWPGKSGAAIFDFTPGGNL